MLRRLTRSEISASLTDLFELSFDWVGRFSSDPASDLGFTTDASLLVVSGPLADELLQAAEDVADSIVSDLPKHLPCSSSSPDSACATEAIATFGPRVFRRPLTDSEAMEYRAHFDSIEQDSNFSTALKWTLVAMLQSPSFVYRSEIGTVAGQERKLSGYELATELSYMYSGSTPDETLLDLAASGEIHKPEVRREQAERLLGEGAPRRLDVMQEFFRQWLGYHSIVGATRGDIENFAAEISPKMVAETQLFIDQVIFGQDGTLDDLLLADFTTIDSVLSDHYGYGNVQGNGFERVTRPPEYGRGLLAQGSLLASHAQQQHSSPTKRGLLFTEKFLCMAPPEVPADVPPLPTNSPGGEASTTREQYEVLHGGVACKNCHAAFEPYGYAMEHFDEAGRFRATDNGHSVDVFVDSAPLPDGSSIEVDGMPGLENLIETTDLVDNCFSGLVATYLYSGAGGTSCLAEDARRRLSSGELSIMDYLVELSQAPHLTTRRLD